MIEKKWVTKTGLLAVCWRNTHRCGYVGVTPSHPLHGTAYDDISYDDMPLDVHGGITFSSDVSGSPYPMESEDLWWFGFDCDHAGDNRLDGLFHDPDGVVRSLPFVKRECEYLAQQLTEIKTSAERYTLTKWVEKNFDNLVQSVNTVVQIAEIATTALNLPVQETQVRYALKLLNKKWRETKTAAKNVMEKADNTKKNTNNMHIMTQQIYEIITAIDRNRVPTLLANFNTLLQQFGIVKS